VKWEILETEGIEDRPIVRRANVPGGWVYQVERVKTRDQGRDGDPTVTVFGWHPPVFVPGGAP
jgi:hypothetical protein